MAHLLDVRDLVTRFRTEQGLVYAVNGVSWTLDSGETLAIVGESGSGKSVSVLSIMGLIPQPAGEVGGQALLGGRDLLKLRVSELRRVRGREIAMVFQDPMTSLNPVLSIGYQLTEALEAHMQLRGAAARREAAELLRMVGIPDATERLSDFPHEFSGGQRQRIMIAMALSCRPSVLIADEPTTALDVTIQAQIVELVGRLQQSLGMAILWITHDLALVAGLADRVAVMYAGTIVEHAPVADLYAAPAHPYTLGLLRALPRWDGQMRERLVPIDGAPPDAGREFDHCPFAARCPFVVERCRLEKPTLVPVAPGRSAACWRAEEVLEGASRGARA